MYKKLTLLVVVLLSIAGLGRGQEAKLGVTLDITYVSRYIWRGIDTYPQNHSATQPSIDIDLFDTGFGINIWSSMANRSGFEESKEIDYTIYYDAGLYEDEFYATDYIFTWTCYAYPNLPKEAADMQEVTATFCWPKILPGGLAPHYTVVCTWPSVGNSDISDSAGWLHIFGLCYDLAAPPLLSGTEKQIIQLSADMTYNDGAYGQDVDHDWSHAVFGISTGFDLGDNVTFTPGFYYQSSWDDSINTQDEYWVSLGFAYQF